MEFLIFGLAVCLVVGLALWVGRLDGMRRRV